MNVTPCLETDPQAGRAVTRRLRASRINANCRRDLFTVMQNVQRVLTLLIVGIASQAMSQDTNSVKVSDYFGYYLTEVADDPFPNFNQLEIFSCDSLSHPETVCGRVLFWGDSIIASPFSDRSCPTKRIRITRDSLAFSSEECVGEVYTFAGHWLFPGGTFDRIGRPPVLDGMLSHYVKGRLLKRATVRFLYSPGE